MSRQVAQPSSATRWACLRRQAGESRYCDSAQDGGGPEALAEGCLYHVEGIGVRNCARCGSEIIPMLVPPIAHKPINENWVIRSTWGFARARLEVATKVVVIGLSFAPTDFYARWLLRSTVGVRDNVEVFVVNPSNDRGEFSDRMKDIFLKGYRADFHEFAEIDAILGCVGRRPGEPSS